MRSQYNDNNNFITSIRSQHNNNNNCITQRIHVSNARVNNTRKMENLAQQIDEIEALAAIYGDDWQTEDLENKAYSIKIADGDNSVTLYLKMPIDYPSSAPPEYQISAPHLDHKRKIRIGNILDEVYSSFVGETVIYQWVERIREELQCGALTDEADLADDLANVDEIVEEAQIPVEQFVPQTSNTEEECPRIHHGEVIVDRKSSFQGHAAFVSSVEQVKQVLNSLLSNRKIEQAKHNIYAYRILREDRKTFVQDCDDDGEHGAGGRLLHLLQIVEAKNILVVVTRWYGGIHLGPDRFRHINNAARQVLQDAQLISKHRDQKK